VEAPRRAGVNAYVLQIGLDGASGDAGDWSQTPSEVSPGHLYVRAPKPSHSYQRTRMFYGQFLRKYEHKMRQLYNAAVQKWGKPDILHAHVSLPAGYAAATVGAEVGVPVIVTEHYSGFESDARFWWRLGSYVREMSGRIHAFYAVSPGYAKRIAKTGLVNQVRVLPNPIDTDLFHPMSASKDDRSFRLVSTGRLGFVKGTDVLLSALKEVTGRCPWTLDLFGDTSDKKRYSKWLDDPAFVGRVTLNGHVSQEHLAKSYNASDLYVVSSRSETANVSMLEAMACGLPVITTRSGGPETLVDESVARFVMPDDPMGLAQAILDATSARERHDAVAARRFVQDRYSIPRMGQLILSEYRQAISRQGAAQN
jgi:L-malate glycosyltransferase